MKLHDFGLWFKHLNNENGDVLWSKDVYMTYQSFEIYYDSVFVGSWQPGYGFIAQQRTPYLLKIKDGKHTTITKDIFEIVPNPDYKG